MASFGIKLTTVFYFAMGGFIGESVRRICQGRSSEVFEKPIFIGAVLTLNALAIFVLITLRHRALTEPPLRGLGRPLDILIHGLPVTNRIAFFLFSIMYAIGFIVFALFA